MSWPHVDRWPCVPQCLSFATSRLRGCFMWLFVFRAMEQCEMRVVTERSSEHLSSVPISSQGDLVVARVCVWWLKSGERPVWTSHCCSAVVPLERVPRLRCLARAARDYQCLAPPHHCGPTRQDPSRALSVECCVTPDSRDAGLHRVSDVTVPLHWHPFGGTGASALHSWGTLKSG